MTNLQKLTAIIVEAVPEIVGKILCFLGSHN